MCNTCRFALTDAAVGRDTDDLVTAEIELFRNGDVLVVTNGVSDFRPRELPFPHDGYGQDDEWVSANFTNATEIASAGGYAAWVDAQVGEGLTNGLYKLTVSVAEAPPEATLVSVGDVSVTITNAGEYVFFEKGTPNTERADVGCFYLATEPGTFELAISGDAVSVTDSGGATVSSGHTWDTDGGVIGARHFSVGRSLTSTSPSGTVFTVTFTPANSGTNTIELKYRNNNR